MDRSLFSQSYSTIPAVRIARTNCGVSVDLCKKYSLWNRLDPESDVFFQDAEYEAVIDLVVSTRTGGISRCSSVNFLRKNINAILFPPIPRVVGVKIHHGNRRLRHHSSPTNVSKNNNHQLLLVTPDFSYAFFSFPSLILPRYALSWGS